MVVAIAGGRRDVVVYGSRNGIQRGAAKEMRLVVPICVGGWPFLNLQIQLVGEEGRAAA